MPSFLSIPTLSGMLLGCLGLAMIALSVRALRSRRGAAKSGVDLHKELDRLLAEIGRGLRALSSPSRSGGAFYREKQAEVGRLLAEMQNRLRLLDDSSRQRYEARAGQALVAAARAGITLPPSETAMISGLSAR